MTLEEISNRRSFNQQITGTNFSSAKDIVGWMGAMQAQHYAMAKWAIGLRLPGSTDEIIERAIDDADIIRTHILRPTWHFVSSDDIHWMLELTAPRIIKRPAFRHKELELDGKTLRKTIGIIEKILCGRHLTRREIMSELEKQGVRTDDFRSYHIMFYAEGHTQANKENNVAVPRSRSITCWVRRYFHHAVCHPRNVRETRSVVLIFFFSKKHPTIELTWGETATAQAEI